MRMRLTIARKCPLMLVRIHICDSEQDTVRAAAWEPWKPLQGLERGLPQREANKWSHSLAANAELWGATSLVANLTHRLEGPSLRQCIAHTVHRQDIAAELDIQSGGVTSMHVLLCLQLAQAACSNPEKHAATSFRCGSQWCAVTQGYHVHR